MLLLQTGCEMEGFLMSITTDGTLSNSQGIHVTVTLQMYFTLQQLSNRPQVSMVYKLINHVGCS